MHCDTVLLSAKITPVGIAFFETLTQTWGKRCVGVWCMICARLCAQGACVRAWFCYSMVLLPHRKVERFSRLACTTLHVHINCTPDADTFLLHIWEGLILHGPAQLPCFLNMYCSYLPGLDDNFTTAQTTVYQPLLADVSLLTQIPRCYSNVQSPSYLAICNVNTSYCHSSLSSLDRVDINAHTLHLSDSGIYVCIGVGANTSYSFELNVVGKRLPFYLFFRSFFFA